MPSYPFLSDEWVENARAIQSELASSGEPVQTSVRMNLVIDEVPFAESRLDAHLDTSAGTLELERGHLDGADLKVTLDYATAKAILVEGDAQAGMAAFMAGRIRVEGDMSKLLAFQATPPSDRQLAIALRLREITD